MTPSGFRIAGADGPLHIPPGGFYINTKARCRRMMQNHLSRSARQVYACLELATMGWQQELAVIQDKNGKRPLTTSDISDQTGIDKPDVRHCLNELQAAGLAERRSARGGSLFKGNVEIYSWAEPRTPPIPDKGESAHPQKQPLPEWIPDSWQTAVRYAKRWKYEFPSELGDERSPLLERVAQVALALENAENEMERVLEEVCAQDRPNKEERTARTEEITSSSGPSSELEETTTTEQALEPEPAPEPLMQAEPDEPQNLSHEVSDARPEPGTLRDPDVGLVAGQLGMDQDAAKKLIRDTRSRRADATAAEIVRAAFWKVKQLRGKIQGGGIGNMAGLLITAIPKMADGAQWLEIRAELKREEWERQPQLE